VWIAEAGCGERYLPRYDVIRETNEIRSMSATWTQKFGLYEDLTSGEPGFRRRVFGLDRRKQRVEDAIERLGLGQRRNQLAGSLSGGWKQRMALAACMLHEPQLLLLDEPTAGVDPKARRDFWDQIHVMAAQGITILVSTHYMDEAERCHEIVYIAYGRLLTTADQPRDRRGRPHDWAVSAQNGDSAAIAALSRELSGKPGIDAVAAFGAGLHVGGRNEAALEAPSSPIAEVRVLLAAHPAEPGRRVHRSGRPRGRQPAESGVRWRCWMPKLDSLCSFPPCGGRVGRGVLQRWCCHNKLSLPIASGNAHAQRATPHPATTRLTTFAKSPLPSPQGGREVCSWLMAGADDAFWSRFLAVFIKEFVQMRRDRITFAMMVGVPLMQLILFGYAINSDPKSLPTAVVMGENTTFARSIVTALQSSAYFKMDGPAVSEPRPTACCAGQGAVRRHHPGRFHTRYPARATPHSAGRGDATDPAATSNAIAALITSTTVPSITI
jgi:energy-coupling factor transporter ATP-binding protein EcfA2